MKTAEEIKKGLIDPEVFCGHCTYNGEPNGCNHPNGLCQAWENADDAYELIQYLETFAPPVTIGTQIFSVCYIEDNDGFYVKSSVVVEIWYNCNGWFFLEECHTGPAFKKSDIGKLVYLNREEAELVCEEFNAKLPLKEG